MFGIGYQKQKCRSREKAEKFKFDGIHGMREGEKVTANDISIAMKKRFADAREFSFAEEVSLTTGGGCRRIDMICVDCYRSNGFRIDGFEYKVSTADLRRELSDPSKHVDFFNYIDYYTLVCPAEVVNPVYDIIPKNWGVLIVNEDHTTKYRRKPLALHDKDYDRKISRGFFASFVRANQNFKPSKVELDSMYQKGLQEGRERAEQHYRFMEGRVTREADKIAKYDRLMVRFGIYSKDDIDGIMDEFEAYRKLDPKYMKAKIQGVINGLTELNKNLFSDDTKE